MNKDKHAEMFAGILQTEIDLIKRDELYLHLESQKQTYAPRWSWDARINEWTDFLNTLPSKQLSASDPNLETLQNNHTTETEFVGL
jgi:hypothetical protein